MISDSDDHSVNLFQPSIDIEMTVDALSKVGDGITYSITVTNTSSADSPNLVGNVTFSLTGLASEPIDLAPGASHAFTRAYTVQAGDPDPLLNTATVTTSPVGFPNVISDSDEASTNLFQPSITIDKTGDTLSKVGDVVNYTITVTNTSSADSPNLVGAVVDTMLGINQAVDMAPGDVVVINDTYTVLVGDPDPLLNTATVTTSPVGFPNVISDSDDHSVNLFQPSIDIEMTVPWTPNEGRDGTTYSITVTNTSSADSPNLVGNVTFLIDWPGQRAH